jgi:serine phosphatase RsbU (regulator of sigma subunit)
LASEEFEELNNRLNLKIKELERINTNIKDSIEYASLMQQAILPDVKILENFCLDSFICWNPKDIVGGDVYFFNMIDQDSILIMVIDGAGHGVSGAFLTMLVKAIEEQIFAKIRDGKLEASPARILEYFNQSIKKMLHQTNNSEPNSGFDGGILYYNQKTKVCKYAGAKTPLYIVNNGELTSIRSDRKNVGYRRTKINQKYTEYDISIQENTKLYITTDGIPDQEGIVGCPFGKERFKQILLENHHRPFSEQYDVLQECFLNFKGERSQNDDITAIGLKF